MKTWLLLICALTLSAAAKADVTKEIATCAVKAGDLERLSCYDSLAKRNGLNGPQNVTTPTSGVGKWDVSEKINPIDDSKTVTLMLTSDSGQNKWRKPIVLIARCLSNETEVFIVWNDYLGRTANVLTRIGSEEAATKSWALSTDSKATFYPDVDVSFLKSLMKADKFVAQVTPYNDNPITAVFDTSGLKNALKPLRATCGW